MIHKAKLWSAVAIIFVLCEIAAGQTPTTTTPSPTMTIAEDASSTAPTTVSPTTTGPTTISPTTTGPTTVSPSTTDPTTVSPSTTDPTTVSPTTTGPTTVSPTTTGPTTVSPTTTGPTTVSPTTTGPTTVSPTTTGPTTTGPTTTEIPTTKNSTTEIPTTEIPTTTPLPPPTNASNPFPKNIGTFRSTDPLNSCINLNGALEIVVAVQLNDSNKNMPLDVPEKARVTEICQKDIQQLILDWTVVSTRNSSVYLSNKITFRFEKASSEKENDLTAKQSFHVTHIKVEFPPDQFPGYTGKIDDMKHYSAKNLSTFATPLNSSYSCTHLESIVAKNADEIIVFELKMENLRVEAYTNKTDFSPNVSCKADDKHHSKKGLIIGLSVALVLLLVGGAVGYYIWRRRQQAGYERIQS